MDRTCLLALWLYRRTWKHKQNRKLWILPLLARRNELGAFTVLFDELLSDENKFFNYFRMSISYFKVIHAKLTTTNHTVTHGAENIIRLSSATERQPEASERSHQDQCYNGLTVTVRLKPDGKNPIV